MAQHKAAILGCWLFTQVIALTYCLLAAVSAKNVEWLRATPMPPTFAAPAPARVWNAALAALILSILALVLAAVWSGLVLGRTVIKREKMGGFSYGMMLASSFGLPFLLITTGVLLNALSPLVGSYEEAETGWRKDDSAAYTATMAFAFILAACFLIYSILLVLFRGAFVPDLRRGGGAVEMPETPGTARE